MAGHNFNKKKETPHLISFLSEKKSSLSKNSDNLNFSFEDYCCKQKYASSFLDWQKCGLLSKAMEVLHGYSKSPVIFDTSGKFTLYNDFPKSNETLYDFPEHVTPDASWVRIHINGPAVIIGHIVSSTFYVVFLDKTHKFWLNQRAKEKMLGKKSTRPGKKGL
jgi:hypothetical protein